MAGFVPSPNTLRVLWHFSLHGRPQLNVTHAEYSLAGPLNPSIGETMFVAATSSAQFQLALAQLGTHWSLLRCEVIDIRSDSNQGQVSTSLAVTGAEAGTPLPDQSSVVVTLRTAKTGRSHRGRVYTAGWTAAAVTTEGTISDLAAAAASNYVNALIVGIQAGGGVLAIRSPALPERPAHDGSTLPAKDYEITPVTAIPVRDRIWDTNRRRIDTLHR